MGTHSSYELVSQSRSVEREREREGVVALHLPIGRLKTRSGFEPVPRCECIPAHCPIRAGTGEVRDVWSIYPSSPCSAFKRYLAVLDSNKSLGLFIICVTI